MTYPHGPREDAPNTIRLEDQPLPDREVSFQTPRAGDWLLLAVLVVALLGIGARVWSQLGFGDPIGRAIFFGLLLLAIYWTALIYIFKLSLAVRVGPQGLAIVRGPWRIELRWSEITRLMERPQTAGGRRYRWVVALARDNRRIQIREDALLDYERFRREVYQRYRVWRDHGGTWGATGGGPFIAREAVASEARWWAFLGLMVTLPGLYLALLLPITNPAGYALLALALVCYALAAGVLLRRRAYALDGRMIEARGALQRARLTWRDVVKVERTHHPAGGIILAGIAVGRLTLRLASRGDAGIRGFAWSPRAPEYLTVRGGGRQARIRLHRLNHPEELLAWVEYYTNLRRSGPSRPLETAAATAPRRTSAPSEPLEAGAALEAAGAVGERAPDLSGASGPVDPWGGARYGDPLDEPAHEAPSRREPLPTPMFQGAPLGASFREQDGLDQPPAASDANDQNDEAWLRETGALFNVNGRASAPPQPASPRGVIADAQTVATPTPPPPAPPRAPTLARHFAPPPAPARAPAPPLTPPRAPMPPPRTPQPTPPFAPPFARRATPPPRPASPFAPYVPDMPEEAEPQQAPAAHRDTPPRMPDPGAPDESERFDYGEADDASEAEENGEREEPQAPWREAGWRPPILPRFGPSGAEPDAPPRHGDHPTNR